MKERLFGALIGCVIGLIVTLFLYSFYVSANPQATEMDKGVILFAGVVVIFALSVIGFKIGEDP